MKYTDPDYYSPYELKKFSSSKEEKEEKEKKKRERLYIPRKSRNSVWSLEEDKIIMDNPRASYAQLQILLPKHKSYQIKNRRIYVLKKGLEHGEWAKNDTEKLIIAYEKYGNNNVAIASQIPNKSIRSIDNKIRNLIKKQIIY